MHREAAGPAAATGSTTCDPRPAVGPPTDAARWIQSEAELVDALGIEFSDEQLAAITAPMEPGVIIAGAGSGKTTVMAARVVWLVGTGAVRPEQVLGLTFTRKAAAELSQRTRSALVRAGVIDADGTDEAGEQLIMTYDAFAARLVAEHGLRLGIEPESRMITGAARFRLAARVTDAAAGPFEQLSRLRPETVTERVLKLDGDLQQHLVSSSALDDHAHHWRRSFQAAPPNNRGSTYADIKKAVAAIDERLELASLVDDYQALKHRLDCHEFADQMAIAARLATEEPQVSDILRDTFRVVLLDEYQDTSAAQAIMLQGLFSGIGDGTGRGHPVTAVGDPFQAIYGWRGAAASNILQFAQDFPTADGRPARRYQLTINRRSGQTILDLANRLSEPLRSATDSRLTGRSATNEAGQQPGLLQAAPGAGSAEVWAATFADWPTEAAWIADQIIAMRAAGRVPAWSQIAVLTRRNADIGTIYAELTGRDVPAEIVGLGGLLSLPEVADVVSTLRVTDDVTANPDLIRLLTGPRWNIGSADLARLGARAAALAADRSGQHAGDSRPDEAGENAGAAQNGQAVGPSGQDPGVLDALEQAVADTDPTEVVSLLDAVEDPGDGFGTDTLSRFAGFARELTQLRNHSDEPVLDLCHRIVSVIGLDVELLATDQQSGRAQRGDQLGAFLDAVGDYADADGQPSLPGLLAYLRAESDHGNGLDQAVPTGQESVKLLTVHKAKGLEWDAVFLPALVQGTFPSDRVTDNWVTTAAALPADLRGDADAIPQLAEATHQAIADYHDALKADHQLAEDRLAYVAATRARRILIGSGHTWRPQTAKPRIPSRYLELIIAEATSQQRMLAEAPPPEDTNPLDRQAPAIPWPRPLDPQSWDRRQQAADLVTAAREQLTAANSAGNRGAGTLLPADPLSLDEEDIVAAWDADIDRLLAEASTAAQGSQPVELPDAMSATQLLQLHQDPDAFVSELARPMPAQPRRQARLGTQFHRWIENQLSRRMITQPQLVDPDELADRADYEIAGEAQFRALCDAFASGRYSDAVPVAVEQPVSVLLGSAVIRGRIDAVFRIGADGELSPAGESHPGAGQLRYQVVDWKTSERQSIDPWQLAIYRLAWAELAEVPPAAVDAVFYAVSTDQIIRPTHLPGRAELERVLDSKTFQTGSATGPP
jgi:DNA helicase-2/ATP-dependent DNA helicase PcrA